jgi:hypothetical protein
MSDRLDGMWFSAEGFDEVMAQLGVETDRNTGYNPRDKSAVERLWASVGAGLQASGEADREER